MLIHGEGIAVKAVQAILGSDPDEAEGILNDRIDGGIGEALLDGEMLELDIVLLSMHTRCYGKQKDNCSMGESPRNERVQASVEGFIHYAHFAVTEFL